MDGNSVFSLKPLRSLPWTISISHDASNQCFCEPQNQGAAVLQNVAAVGNNAMSSCNFGSSADGKFQFVRDHVNERISARRDPFEKPLFMAIESDQSS
jgi:hypothetical protein